MEPTITAPIKMPLGLWLLLLSDVGASVSLGVLEEREGVDEVDEEAVELGEFAFKQWPSSEFPTILDSKSVWDYTIENLYSQ